MAQTVDLVARVNFHVEKKSADRESVVTYSPIIFRSEEKATMKLKVMFLSGKSQVDTLVNNLIIKIIFIKEVFE